MDDKREIVRRGFEACARDYAESRDQFQNESYLQDLAQRLPVGGRILDLGCGSGKPIDAFFLEKGFDVTGIDVSEEQIRPAKQALPSGRFVQGEMTEVDFPAESFEAIVSFYAIFHVPREEHAAMLRKAWGLLRPGGHLLVTMGSGEWEGTEEDFHGRRCSGVTTGGRRISNSSRRPGSRSSLRRSIRPAGRNTLSSWLRSDGTRSNGHPCRHVR